MLFFDHFYPNSYINCWSIHTNTVLTYCPLVWIDQLHFPGAAWHSIEWWSPLCSRWRSGEKTGIQIYQLGRIVVLSMTHVRCFFRTSRVFHLVLESAAGRLKRIRLLLRIDTLVKRLMNTYHAAARWSYVFDCNSDYRLRYVSIWTELVRRCYQLHAVLTDNHAVDIIQFDYTRFSLSIVVFVIMNAWGGWRAWTLHNIEWLPSESFPNAVSGIQWSLVESRSREGSFTSAAEVLTAGQSCTRNTSLVWLLLMRS